MRIGGTPERSLRPEVIARRAGTLAGRALRPAANRLGYDLVRRSFYSPLIALDQVAPERWDRPLATPGLHVDPAAQLDYLERELGPHLAEFRPAREPTGSPRELHLHNGYYESIDADVLYAMLRRHRPRRLVELGSGFSTLVIDTAARANAADGHPLSRRTFDPYAPAELEEVEPLSATEVPLEVFDDLAAGDVLFVDTTHTVKLGSDVNRIVLEVLPRLQPGVLVHFHDVFLPWEVPRTWVTELRRVWSEQYLLQAFLAMNDGYAVVLGSHAVIRHDPAAVRRLCPNWEPERSTATAADPYTPAAFWIVRRDGAAGS